MIKRGFVAFVLAAAATLAAPTAPSHADGSGILASQSGVVYECADHAYTYSLSLPAGTTGWSMEVTIRSQDGLEAATDFVYSQPGTAGSGAFQLCPSDGAGTYSMTAIVNYHDGDYNEGSFALPTATFSMRLPMTRTTLKATVKKHTKTATKTITLRTKTTDERPNGYYGTSYPNVVIQRKVGVSWRIVPNLDVSADSDGDGIVRFTWPLKKRATLRAHTQPRDYHDYTASDSGAVRIR